MTENLLNLHNLLPQDFVQKYSGLAGFSELTTDTLHTRRMYRRRQYYRD